VQQVLSEVLVDRVFKEMLDQLVISELPDHRVQQAFKVKKASLVRKALKAPRDQTEDQVLDLPDPQDLQDRRATLDRQGLSGREAVSDRLERQAVVALRVL